MAKYLLLLITITFLSSCMTLKPESARVSSKDYNDRQTVFDPHYVKRPNIIAYAGTLAATAAGAYGMYKLAPVTQQNAESTHKVGAANIALGALTGFAIGTAIQYLAGKNKRVPIDTPERWLKKANNNLTVYDYNLNNLIAIPTANSNKYDIRDLTDIKGYYRTFPGGAIKSDLYIKSLNIVKRSELPEVISLETLKSLNEKAKYTYFERSESVDQLTEAASRYKGFAYALEPKGIQVTKSYSDAIKMLSLVPDIKNKKGLYINSLQTPYVASEAKDMLQKIGKENFLLEESDLKSSTAKQHQHTLENIFYTVQPKELEYGYKILSKYNFLKFNTKKEFAMSFFWDKIYEKHNKGTKIISEFTNLKNLLDLKKIEISSEDLNTHLIKELEKEAKKNIVVNHIGSHSTINDNIEKWKKSAFWDAPLITSAGELKFLLYGTVENKSKFDLPITILGSGYLNEKLTIDFLNFIQFSEKTAFLGTRFNKFIIPKLSSGETQVYAILLDFGRQNQATGINLFGTQGTIELSLDKSKTDVIFSVDEINPNLIKKQNLWLDIMKSGFEKTKITDPFNWTGKFEYVHESYEKSYQKFMNFIAESMSNKNNQSNSSSTVHGDCSIHRSEREFTAVSIYDGGSIIGGADVSDKSYFVSYTTNNGKSKSTNNPHSDSSSDVLGYISENELPVSVSVSFRYNGNKTQKSCAVTIFQSGYYDIRLKR